MTARINIGIVIALFAATAILGQKPGPAEGTEAGTEPPPTTLPPQVTTTGPPDTIAVTTTTIKVPESTIANLEVVAEDVAIPPPDVATLPPDDAGLYRLRMCESTDRYGVNTGNGYYGAYQFDRTTWDSVASRWDPPLVGVRPDLASPADQDQMVRWLWSERGRQPWPVCGRRV